MRMFHEYRNEGKIFDLPKDRFFRGNPVLDTSAVFQGRRASTPLGPAAGPHGQMAQNIVLCWLAGARIIELKTIQILDELKIHLSTAGAFPNISRPVATPARTSAWSSGSTQVGKYFSIG